MTPQLRKEPPVNPVSVALNAKPTPPPVWEEGDVVYYTVATIHADGKHDVLKGKFVGPHPGHAGRVLVKWDDEPATGPKAHWDPDVDHPRPEHLLTPAQAKDKFGL